MTDFLLLRDGTLVGFRDQTSPVFQWLPNGEQLETSFDAWRPGLEQMPVSWSRHGSNCWSRRQSKRFKPILFCAVQRQLRSVWVQETHFCSPNTWVNSDAIVWGPDSCAKVFMGITSFLPIIRMEQSLLNRCAWRLALRAKRTKENVEGLPVELGDLIHKVQKKAFRCSLCQGRFASTAQLDSGDLKIDHLCVLHE
jgi:hypothetical protein